MSWLPKRDKLDPVQASAVISSWHRRGEEGGESRWRRRDRGKIGTEGQTRCAKGFNGVCGRIYF